MFKFARNLSNTVSNVWESVKEANHSLSILASNLFHLEKKIDCIPEILKRHKVMLDVHETGIVSANKELKEIHDELDAQKMHWVNFSKKLEDSILTLEDSMLTFQGSLYQTHELLKKQARDREKSNRIFSEYMCNRIDYLSQKIEEMKSQQSKTPEMIAENKKQMQKERSRAKINAYARAYYAKKKAEKLAATTPIQ